MARLQDYYRKNVVPDLMKKLGYKTSMQVPRIRKITLNMGVGETTADGRITLLTVECLCACEQAPMMQVDERYEGLLTPEKVDRILEGLS